MADDAMVKEVIEALAEENKTNYFAQSALLTEVAAIRRTLEHLLGEKFSKAFEAYQIEEINRHVLNESASHVLKEAILARAKGL